MNFKIGKARLKWHGTKQVEEEVRDKLTTRLMLAGEHLRSKTAKNISVPTRTAGPSKIGEFPHADTGRLRASIFYEVNAKELVLYVGTPLDYGLSLELGGRSFLQRTLVEEFQAVRRIVTAGIGGDTSIG